MRLPLHCDLYKLGLSLLTLSKLGLSLLLIGCAQSSDTLAPQDFAFSAQGQDRFRLTYFGRDTARSSATTRPASPGPQHDPQASLPGRGALISDHQLFTLLEQELDRRQLCLQGYRILSRRPTARGVTLEGECQSRAPEAQGL